MAKKRVIIPIPTYGFDPTEVAIPWLMLTKNNFEIIFATPNGSIAKADTLMLYGENLGVWKKVLQARKDAVDAYHQMIESHAFKNPINYISIQEKDFDAILLPGGHDKGVKEYLESNILQQVVVNFFEMNKPVAAICHGVVLLARSISPSSNKSVLYNYKTTCLLKKQELLAYHMTRLWLGNYYLTYPELTVEDEVKAALQNVHQFQKGNEAIFRDDEQHLSRGFVSVDRNYVSARWPGDAYNFSIAFIELLNAI